MESIFLELPYIHFGSLLTAITCAPNPALGLRSHLSASVRQCPPMIEADIDASRAEVSVDPKQTFGRSYRHGDNKVEFTA
jgi:hypothetical protein